MIKPIKEKKFLVLYYFEIDAHGHARTIKKARGEELQDLPAIPLQLAFRGRGRWS